MFKKTPMPDYYDVDYFFKSYKTLDKLLDRERKALSHIDPQVNEIILDVGHGRGTVLKELEKLCRNVIGIDPSKAAFMISKKNLQESSVHLIRGSATHLPFRSATFDKLLMLEVLEHLDRSDTSKCLRELNRVLRKDGKMVVSTVHMEFPLSTLSKIYRILTASKLSSLHVDEKSHRIMLNLLKDANFFVVNTWLESYAPNQVIAESKGIVEKVLKWLKYGIPFLCSQLWVIAVR